ncbi:MAG: hypothetical protein JST38_09325, partial [Bacteroidetes bacterium]|nr:hypothetical protein [Bacteroidota bacterium]
MRARYPLVALFLSLVFVCNAQLQPGSEAYNAWKLAQIQHPQSPVHAQPAHASLGVQRDGEPCACWITPDSTYTTIENDTEWNASGFGNGDDGSYGPVNLPFDFNLYGQSFNVAYININGNVSFGTYISTFSSSAFPTTGPSMVAPFWADVDLRGDSAGTNIVQYKVTPTSLIVNWTNVGYYNQAINKLNSFQLIISNGTDSVIQGGNNV